MKLGILWILTVFLCVIVKTVWNGVRLLARIKSVLDDGGAVQNFVDALQQLTNPEMLFKVQLNIFLLELSVTV